MEVKYGRMCVLALILAAMPAALYGAGSAQALVAQYQAAQQEGDIEALKRLVFWDGATQYTRETIEKRLTRHLDLEIKRIEFRPLTGDENFDTPRYHPNLKPVGWLVIFFRPPDGDSRFIGESFVVGEKNGEYFITVARRTR